MKPHERYTGLAKAALEIAYDNGGINASRSEKRWRKEFDEWVEQYPILSEDLLAIDAWLAGLTADQMAAICSGEESEQQEVLRDAPNWTWKMLCDFFDEVC